MFLVSIPVDFVDIFIMVGVSVFASRSSSLLQWGSGCREVISPCLSSRSPQRSPYISASSCPRCSPGLLPLRPGGNPEWTPTREPSAPQVGGIQLYYCLPAVVCVFLSTYLYASLVSFFSSLLWLCTVQRVGLPVEAWNDAGHLDQKRHGIRKKWDA